MTLIITVTPKQDDTAATSVQTGVCYRSHSESGASSARARMLEYVRSLLYYRSSQSVQQAHKSSPPLPPWCIARVMGI